MHKPKHSHYKPKVEAMDGAYWDRDVLGLGLGAGGEWGGRQGLGENKEMAYNQR